MTCKCYCRQIEEEEVIIFCLVDLVQHVCGSALNPIFFLLLVPMSKYKLWCAANLLFLSTSTSLSLSFYLSLSLSLPRLSTENQTQTLTNPSSSLLPVRLSSSSTGAARCFQFAKFPSLLLLLFSTSQSAKFRMELGQLQLADLLACQANCHC
jgi:hypothetical protein